MLEVTACVNESDELTSLEVYNTVWPHDAVTIDAVHSFRDSAQDYIDYLVGRPTVYRTLKRTSGGR